MRRHVNSYRHFIYWEIQRERNNTIKSLLKVLSEFITKQKTSLFFFFFYKDYTKAKQNSEFYTSKIKIEVHDLEENGKVIMDFVCD